MMHRKKEALTGNKLRQKLIPLNARLAKEIVIRSVPAPLEIEPIKKQHYKFIMWQCYPL